MPQQQRPHNLLVKIRNGGRQNIFFRQHLKSAIVDGSHFRSMASYSLFAGLGGTYNGSFFRSNSDLKSKPGSNSCAAGYSLASQCNDYVTASYFVCSPNLVWFLIAVVQWVLVPYDAEIVTVGAESIDIDWVTIAAFRVLVN